MWVPDLYLSHLDVQCRWGITIQQPEFLGPLSLGFLLPPNPMKSLNAIWHFISFTVFHLRALGNLHMKLNPKTSENQWKDSFGSCLKVQDLI